MEKTAPKSKPLSGMKFGKAAVHKAMEEDLGEVTGQTESSNISEIKRTLSVPEEARVDAASAQVAEVEVFPESLAQETSKAVTVIDQTGAAVPTTSRDFVEPISHLWEASQKNFVQIGRHLNEAKKRLPHGEYENMLAEELPFSTSNAKMFRTIASAIDSSKLEERLLPRDITAAYYVASLDNDGLAKAAERGIIKPTTKRSEVMEFRKSLKVEPKAEATSHKDLLKAKVRLKNKLEGIDAQIELLEKQSKVYRAELSAVEEKLAEAKQAEKEALAKLVGQ